jgi:hypothetical protein
MELNREKKMKSEQVVLPNPCLEEEEDRTFLRWPVYEKIYDVPFDFLKK